MARKADSGDTKEIIRACAIEMFREKGFKNVTIMQICEAAGVTKRTFYYHYNSKDDLIYGLIDNSGRKAEKLLDALTQTQSNIGILWALMSVYRIDTSNYGPEITRQIYIHALEGTDEDFPYSTYLFQTAVKTVANAQKAGELKNSAPPEDITFALYHAFRSISITWAAQNGSLDLIAGFRQVFSVILGVDQSQF